MVCACTELNVKDLSLQQDETASANQAVNKFIQMKQQDSFNSLLGAEFFCYKQYSLDKFSKLMDSDQVTCS